MVGEQLWAAEASCQHKTRRTFRVFRQLPKALFPFFSEPWGLAACFLSTVTTCSFQLRLSTLLVQKTALQLLLTLFIAMAYRVLYTIILFNLCYSLEIEISASHLTEEELKF